MTRKLLREKIDVLSGNGLPCGGPDAVRVGASIFLSARLGTNLASKQVAHGEGDLPAEARDRYTSSAYVDAMEWPITAQTWWIYEAFRRILAAHGGGLANLVRTNTYFRDLGEFPAMERARALLLPVDPPPSTVLQVPCRAFPDDTRVIIEGLAVLPEAGPREVIRSRLGPGAHYSWGVRVQDAAWVAGQTPAHPLRGVFVESLADLGPEGATLATGNLHLDTREGSITAQATTCYWRIRTILEDGGFSPGDIVQEKIYLRHIQHLPAVERVRRRFYQRADAAPPVFYLGVDDLGRAPSCHIEIDAAAHRSRQLLAGETDGARRFGAAAAAAGPFLLLGGYTARDPQTGRVVRSAAELGTRGASLPRGEDGALAAQALAAYDRMEGFLRSRGSSLEHLVKAEVYLRNPDDLASLQAVHRIVFPSAAPALSVIPMTHVDHDPAVLVKVGGIALAGR